jgi:hypothetical protein
MRMKEKGEEIGNLKRDGKNIMKRRESKIS